MNREATLSNLLNQTFAEISQNGRLIAIYLAIIVPIGAVSNYFQGPSSGSFGFDIGFRLTESLIAQGALAVIAVTATFIMGVALNFWLYAGMVKQTASPGFARFLPWVGIYILASLGIIFGFVLLIVPGVILIVRWTITLPLVIEGRMPAMDTFGASWDRTKECAWSIFGGLVILFILFSILSTIVAGGAIAIGGAFGIGAAAITALSEAVSTVLFTAFAVGAYRLLDDNTDALTEVFQ